MNIILSNSIATPQFGHGKLKNRTGGQSIVCNSKAPRGLLIRLLTLATITFYLYDNFDNLREVYLVDVRSRLDEYK
jgi:hypothetical protein